MWNRNHRFFDARSETLNVLGKIGQWNSSSLDAVGVNAKCLLFEWMEESNSYIVG